MAGPPNPGDAPHGVARIARAIARRLSDEAARKKRELAATRKASIRRVARHRPAARVAKPRGATGFLERVPWGIVARASAIAAVGAVFFVASYVVAGAIAGNGGTAVAEPGTSLSPSPSVSEATVSPASSPSAEPSPTVTSAPEVTPRDPETAGLWGPAPKATDTYADATGCCLPSPPPPEGPHPSTATITLVHEDGHITPVWSPTRDELALVSGGSVGFDDVAIYDASTKATRVIASDIAFGWYPVFTWSPDGDYVAVVTGLYQAPRYFAVLSRSGGDPVLTFPLSGYAFLGVDWSPDGKTLAIGATAAWNSNNTVPRDSHIYILDTESGASERIVDGAFPSFSPDGDSLAFFRDEGRDDSYGVWTVDLADGTLTQISDEYPYSAFTSYASNMETRFTAAWSADGSRLAFLSPEPETTELSADVTYPRVCATYVANADGSGLVKVSEDRVTAPAWLPSGDLLAGTTVYDGTTLTSTTRTTGYFLNGRGLAKAGSVPSKWSGGRSSASADGKYGLMFAKGPGYPEYGWYVVKAGS